MDDHRHLEHLVERCEGSRSPVSVLFFGSVGAREIGEQGVELAKVATATADRYLEHGRMSDAKRSLTDGQRRLRDLKREAAEEERELRAAFQQKRIDASNSGQVIGMLTNSKTRSMLARSRAAAKRSLAQQQQNALGPYRQVKGILDDLISSLADAKSQIAWDEAEPQSNGDTDEDEGLQADLDALDDEFEALEDEAGTAAAAASAGRPGLPPPPPQPAMWAPDPSQRHEYRWWDGSRWTEHVSDKGQTSVDPG